MPNNMAIISKGHDQIPPQSVYTIYTDNSVPLHAIPLCTETNMPRVMSTLQETLLFISPESTCVSSTVLCGVHPATQGCHSRLKGTSRAPFPLIILPAKNGGVSVHAHTGWLLLKGTRGLSYSLTSKWPFIEFLFLDLGQPKFRLQTWGDFSLSYNYKQSASILWGKTLPYTRTDLSKLWRQWRTEEAGVLQSMGLKRVRRNLETEQQQYRFTHTICLYIILYMHMYAYTLKYIL